jgi:hypothetical protein
VRQQQQDSNSGSEVMSNSKDDVDSLAQPGQKWRTRDVNAVGHSTVAGAHVLLEV